MVVWAANACTRQQTSGPVHLPDLWADNSKKSYPKTIRGDLVWSPLTCTYIHRFIPSPGNSLTVRKISLIKPLIMKKQMALKSLSRNELAVINGGGSHIGARLCIPTPCSSDNLCRILNGPTCSCRPTSAGMQCAHWSYGSSHFSSKQKRRSQIIKSSSWKNKLL